MNCGMYRGIMLLEHTMKILKTYLKKDLKKYEVGLIMI